MVAHADWKSHNSTFYGEKDKLLPQWSFQRHKYRHNINIAELRSLIIHSLFFLNIQYEIRPNCLISSLELMIDAIVAVKKK